MDYMLKKYFSYIELNNIVLEFISLSFFLFLMCLHVALILFLLDHVTLDEGPRSSLSSEGGLPLETLCAGKVSSRTGDEEGLPNAPGGRGPNQASL